MLLNSPKFVLKVDIHQSNRNEMIWKDERGGMKLSAVYGGGRHIQNDVHRGHCRGELILVVETGLIVTMQ